MQHWSFLTAHGEVFSIVARRRSITTTDVETLRDMAATRERELYDILLWSQKTKISDLSNKTTCKATIGGHS